MCHHAEGGDVSDETKKGSTSASASYDGWSLGTELPKEMARVRDVVIPAYVAIGPVGAFAASWMRAALDDAARAMAEGDLPGMIAAYEALKEART